MACNSGLSAPVRRAIMREERYTCADCGLVGFERRFNRGGYGFYTALPRVYLSIDHIVPRSRGGTNDRSNLRVLCTTCNTRKGTKLLTEVGR